MCMRSENVNSTDKRNSLSGVLCWQSNMLNASEEGNGSAISRMIRFQSMVDLDYPAVIPILWARGSTNLVRSSYSPPP